MTNISNDMKLVWDCINGIEVKDVYKNFNNLKTFILNNPNDKDSILMKNWLLFNLRDEFLNPKLIEALNIPEHKKYLRNLKIFEELPCMMHKNEFMTFFYGLIYIPSEYYGNHQNFYKGCKWFFNEMNYHEVPDSTFDKLDKYLEDNKILLRSSFNHYNDYNTELNRLRLINSNNTPDDWKKEKEDIEYQFRRNGIKYSDYDVYRSYENIKTGIVGEYDIFNKIINQNNAIFVAKEFGNGFGYDLFYTTKIPYREFLIEVKATLKEEGKEYFTITENEYDVLMDSLKRINTDFVLVRVFIDLKKNNNYDFKVFRYDPIKCEFISINNEDGNTVIYKQNKKNKYLFENRKKTLELKIES